MGLWGYSRAEMTPHMPLLVLQKKSFLWRLSLLRSMPSWIDYTVILSYSWKPEKLSHKHFYQTQMLWTDKQSTVRSHEWAGSQLDRDGFWTTSGPPRKSISAEFWLKPTFSLPQQYSYKTLKVRHSSPILWSLLLLFFLREVTSVEWSQLPSMWI